MAEPHGDERADAIVLDHGRGVSVPYIHTLRFRDGLHIPFNLLFDRLLMPEQLGLLTAPATR